MQALSERIDEWLRGATFEGYEPLGFTGLKTAVPSPDGLVGHQLVRVDRRAKYVILHFDTSPELRVAFHLSQAGRVDFESPPKKTKPKGSAVRWRLSDHLAVRARSREGGLSATKLGEHFTVHGKAGLPCPVCGDDLKRVSYESHEVVYCPQCQTGGKVLADRRLSRLVK